MEEIEQNTEFELAVAYVLNTAESVFLTGKAGTGKTTFLKHIAKQKAKNIAIAAPTGIAAMNAGGVTLHSLFQLPIGTYLNEGTWNEGYGNTYNKVTLFKNLKLSKDKRNLLRSLELLVIDEVSMLRCDTLDAIDAILRVIRNARDLPFGGLQILFIGDLHQLSPVCSNSEWEILKPYYASPFFFYAKGYTELKPVYIEFSKVFRQADESFITLLNKVRYNSLAKLDIDLLNERYKPNLESEEGVVCLTTHNHKADKINAEQLAKLTGAAQQFQAKITGDFNDKNFPTEESLTLKIGAQVMFVKNDSTGEKRYFNGRLGVVKSLNNNGARITCHDDGLDVELSADTWKTIRYVQREGEELLHEEETGSFTQLPIKLAWAITIHKSQGLTFDKLHIDAEAAFAAGQVYVALSRCRTLEGISLSSRLNAQAIFTDQAAAKLSETKKDNKLLSKELVLAKENYAILRVANTFALYSHCENIAALIAYTQDKKFADKDLVLDKLRSVNQNLPKLADTAAKFSLQIQQYYHQNRPLNTESITWLVERVSKAITYFGETYNTEVLKNIEQIKMLLLKKTGVKQFVAQLQVSELVLWGFIEKLKQLNLFEFDFKEEKNILVERKITLVKEQKTKKGDSELQTLALLKEAKTLKEIASIRGISVNTVENHLTKLIATELLAIDQVMNMDRVYEITSAAALLKTTGLSAIREKLGEEYSYTEIKMALASIR